MADLLPYGPLIAEHCILTASLEPGRSPAAQPLSGEERAALVGSVRSWEAWLDACEDSSEPPGGYILTKPGTAGQQVAAGAAGEAGAAGAAGVYEEFEPVLLRQHAHKPSLAFPTFDAAVAEFFGKAAGQRAAAAAAAKEKAAVGKLEAIRRDHEKRLGSLGKEAESAQLKVGGLPGRAGQERCKWAGARCRLQWYLSRGAHCLVGIAPGHQGQPLWPHVQRPALLPNLVTPSPLPGRPD